MNNKEIFSTEDARRIAIKRVPKLIFDFVDGATGREDCNERNQNSIRELKLQPKVLKNVQNRSLKKEFLGHFMEVPFGIAPMGMCNLVWPKADQFFARASIKHGMPVALSCAGSTSLEDMFEMSKGRAWMQVNLSGSEDWFWEIINRSKKVGYKVLIFTVDVPQVARRTRDLKNGFAVPFRLGARQIWDFATHPYWSTLTLLNGPPKPMNFITSETQKHFDRHGCRGSADLDLLLKLRERWPGTLIVKGVQSEEDAILIKETGAEAIYVSNHGGRQLDAALPSIISLKKIRYAVGEGYPLLFDSGIRNGEDIIKALAFGADFVMIGRALMYAVAAGGARGVNTLLEVFKEEMSTVMAQIGVTSIDEIGAQALATA